MESNNLNERAAKVLGWEHHKTDIIDFWINPEGNTANYPNWANSLDASMRDFMGLLRARGYDEVIFAMWEDSITCTLHRAHLPSYPSDPEVTSAEGKTEAEAFLKAALEVLE